MITIPRLYGAIEGFFLYHGHWPTKLWIDNASFDGHIRKLYNGQYEPRVRDLLIALAARIQILPRPSPNYMAEDDHCNSYDYGELGGIDGAPHGIFLHIWLTGQLPEISAIREMTQETSRGIIASFQQREPPVDGDGT